jgi:transcription elongation factor GreA
MAAGALMAEPVVMNAFQLDQPGEPLLVPAGYEAQERELQSLRKVRDLDLPRLFRELRGFVAADVAEEMVRLREDQALVEARIARLEELLRTAGATADEAPSDVVALGRTVEVEYLRSGRVMRYRVVERGTPATHGQATVSAASPTGQALIGRSSGEAVSVRLPNGAIEELLILSVGGDRS